MKKHRKYTLYLEDLLLSMTRIQEYISLTNAESFETNYLVVDAVVRNFEVIGETAKQIPQEIKNKYPQIPWKQMNILRNIIIHDYFGLDYKIIWKIASEYLPQNKTDVEHALSIEKLNE